MGAETIHDFRSHVDPPAFTGLTAIPVSAPRAFSGFATRSAFGSPHNRCGFERGLYQGATGPTSRAPTGTRAQDFGAHEVGEVTISSRLAEDDAVSRLWEEILRFTMREMVFQQPKP